MSVVLLVCLNFPPWIRYLPGFALLIGAIPGPSCGNFQAYMQPIADQFEELADGVYAYDANEQKQVYIYDMHRMLHP